MAVDNKKAKRKPGGGRKKSKPDYDPSAILQNQMDLAVALYDKEEHPSLQTIANELDLNPIKVRKLLITAGVYRSEVADQVNRVFNKHRASGLSHTEAIVATMRELNLSKSSVTSYLPYEKGVYFPAETDSSNISVGAERIRRMRKREKILEELRAEQSEEALWAAVIEFQGYKFRTYSGLVFSYSLKKGRGDTYTKELFIDRRENSKSLASVGITSTGSAKPTVAKPTDPAPITPNNNSLMTGVNATASPIKAAPTREPQSSFLPQRKATQGQAYPELAQDELVEDEALQDDHPVDSHARPVNFDEPRSEEECSAAIEYLMEQAVRIRRAVDGRRDIAERLPILQYVSM